MRRKSNAQGNYNNNNNQQRKQNYRQQGGGSHHQNRPRKNYAAAREKYLQQARDALAAGDRVLAENYFQHADHCYRMMVEEGYNFRNNREFNNNQNQQPQAEGQGNAPADEPIEELPENISRLPAFITTAAIEEDRKDEPAVAQSWEE